MTGARGDGPVLIDGRLVPAAEATVSAFDRGLMFGESVFETLKVVDGSPCLWRPHLDRLLAGCRTLGIPVESGELESGVRSLLRERALGLGALRIQVTGGVQPGGGRGMLAGSSGRKPRVVARVDEVPSVAPEVYEGVDVLSASDLCRSLPRLKSGSYLGSLAARRRAQEADAFECVFSRPGEAGAVELLEGSYSSLLSTRGDTLVRATSPDSLNGVTAVTVAGRAHAAGMAVSEEPLSLQTAASGGLLLTSSLLGVCPVRSLDGKTLPDLTTLSRRLAALLDEAEEESRREWSRT